MLVMGRIRYAAIVPFPDNRSEPAKTERPKYPENRCRTTVAERMGGNASGTALYRESGRLFRPRPGLLKRTCINGGQARFLGVPATRSNARRFQIIANYSMSSVVRPSG